MALRSPTCRQLGAWFHAALEAAKEAAGTLRESHPVDAVHDHMVGAAVLMVRAGQVEKAVRVYNVWASSAQYAPIALLRTRPTVIDVQDAIVEAGPSGMEVLRCR